MSAHTHFPKGATVWIRKKDGSEVTGKFVHRFARYVLLDTGKVPVWEIDTMSFRKIVSELAQPSKTDSPSVAK